MTPRDSIIERIRKLAKMTTEAGCSEHEAAAASGMLHRLVQEHNIGLDEIRLKAEALGCIQDYHAVVGSQLEDWFRACGAIAHLFEVKLFFQQESGDTLGLGIEVPLRKIVFFGLPADVAGAVAMAQIIGTAISTEAVRWKKEVKRVGVIAMQSFRNGMIDRLKQRIEELAAAPKPQAYGLILLKGQLVTDEWAKWCRAQNMRFGNARYSGEKQRTDPGAYSAGKSRADGVRLGHHAEVGGTRQIARG